MTSCGRGVRTDVYIHWIQGRGNLIVGDDVLMDGKCSITFASRYSANPTLTIGDHSGIGHGCRFTIGKRITIGRHCRIAADVWMFDSSGHPLDAAARQAGDSPRPDDVRPITIGDNVWIGGRAIIHPGVTIGDHSIVSAGAVVMSDVPCARSRGRKSRAGGDECRTARERGDPRATPSRIDERRDEMNVEANQPLGLMVASYARPASSANSRQTRISTTPGSRR